MTISANTINLNANTSNGFLYLNSFKTYLNSAVIIVLTAPAVACEAILKMSKGFIFGKGNFLDPTYMQAGQYYNGGFVIGSNSYYSATITFSHAFGTIPFVYVTNGSVQNTTCSRLVVGATNISTSQFTMTFYNNAGAGGTSGACTVRWMAIGGW